MKTRKVFYYGKFGLFGLIGLAAFTLVVMLLWNWLVPLLFKGPEVNYWQTLGLLILSKILLTGVIGHGHHPRPAHVREWHDPRGEHPWHGHPWGDRESWKRKFEEKMNGKAEDPAEDRTGDQADQDP